MSKLKTRLWQKILFFVLCLWLVPAAIGLFLGSLIEFFNNKNIGVGFFVLAISVGIAAFTGWLGKWAFKPPSNSESLPPLTSFTTPLSAVSESPFITNNPKTAELNDLNKDLDTIDVDLIKLESEIDQLNADLDNISKSVKVDTAYDSDALDDFDEDFSIFPELLTIRFRYQAADGNTTVRTVEVDEHKGDQYIKGFCQKAAADRTFKLDRIQGNITDVDSGVVMTPASFAARLRGEPWQNTAISAPAVTKTSAAFRGIPAHKEGYFNYEICFTGFSNAERSALEAKALLNQMKVRTTVTKNLNFLCAGDNAGWSKVEKAKEQGVTILTEQQFHELVDDGVVPEANTTHAA